MAFSGYKNQRRRTGRKREKRADPRARKRKKN
jgi:hypothetical protein